MGIVTKNNKKPAFIKTGIYKHLNRDIQFKFSL